MEHSLTSGDPESYMEADLDLEPSTHRVQEALCLMSLDLIKSDQLPRGRSMSQGNKSLKQWTGRMAASQQGGFLLGSHATRSYFTEQTHPQIIMPKTMSVLSNILVYTFSPGVCSKRSLIQTSHLFGFCARRPTRSLSLY